MKKATLTLMIGEEPQFSISGNYDSRIGSRINWEEKGRVPKQIFGGTSDNFNLLDVIYNNIMDYADSIFPKENYEIKFKVEKI